MKYLQHAIATAQEEFLKRIKAAEADSGLTFERYVRYLSMQYHLTKGVSRYFLLAAAHPSTAKAHGLRKFLVQFAFEEEPHYHVAWADLKELGREPLPKPFEVDLWHAYFDSIIDNRPFLRLGAACILENIASGASDVIDRLFAKASFLTKKNTVFFAIHRHGPDLAHGDEILSVLRQAGLQSDQEADLYEGAIKGATLYLRMVDWAITDNRTLPLRDDAIGV